MRRDRVLWLACLGNIYFWFLGQLLQQSVIDYGENVLRLGEMRTTYLLAALAIGIGLGSFAAGYLSGGKIEYGLVPLGSLGLTVFAALLWQPGAELRPDPGRRWGAGLLRRLLHRAHLRHAPASAGQGRKGRDAGRGQPALVRRACSWRRASTSCWPSGCTSAPRGVFADRRA